MHYNYDVFARNIAFTSPSLFNSLHNFPHKSARESAGTSPSILLIAGDDYRVLIESLPWTRGART